MIEVENINILNSLVNHKEGELAKVKDTYYVYKDGKWKEQNTTFSISLYDLNKSNLIKQIENKVIEELPRETVIKKVDAWDNKSANCYLLYNKEFGAFDLFERKCYSNKSLGEVIDYCLEYAKIYLIEENVENCTLEIWCEYQNQITLFLLGEWEVHNFE